MQPNVSAVVQTVSLGQTGISVALRHYTPNFFLRAKPETKVWINAQVRGPAESLRQVQFATLDLIRRAQGHAFYRI